MSGPRGVHRGEKEGVLAAEPLIEDRLGDPGGLRDSLVDTVCPCSRKTSHAIRRTSWSEIVLGRLMCPSLGPWPPACQAASPRTGGIGESTPRSSLDK